MKIKTHFSIISIFLIITTLFNTVVCAEIVDFPGTYYETLTDGSLAMSGESYVLPQTAEIVEFSQPIGSATSSSLCYGMTPQAFSAACSYLAILGVAIDSNYQMELFLSELQDERFLFDFGGFFLDESGFIDYSSNWTIPNPNYDPNCGHGSNVICNHKKPTIPAEHSMFYNMASEDLARLSARLYSWYRVSSENGDVGLKFNYGSDVHRYLNYNDFSLYLKQCTRFPFSDTEIYRFAQLLSNNPQWDNRLTAFIAPTNNQGGIALVVILGNVNDYFNDHSVTGNPFDISFSGSNREITYSVSYSMHVFEKADGTLDGGSSYPSIINYGNVVCSVTLSEDAATVPNIEPTPSLNIGGDTIRLSEQNALTNPDYVPDLLENLGNAGYTLPDADGVPNSSIIVGVDPITGSPKVYEPSEDLNPNPIVPDPFPSTDIGFFGSFWNNLKALFQWLVSLIGALLKSLFVPTDFYFETELGNFLRDYLGDVSDQLTSFFLFAEYEIPDIGLSSNSPAFNGLGINSNPPAFETLGMNVDFVFVNNRFIRDNIGIIRQVLQSFVLILYFCAVIKTVLNAFGQVLPYVPITTTTSPYTGGVPAVVDEKPPIRILN